MRHAREAALEWRAEREAARIQMKIRERVLFPDGPGPQRGDKQAAKEPDSRCSGPDGREKMMSNTLLVCTDGSEHALKAARKAALLAKQMDACVLLLHVQDETKPYSDCVMPWQLEFGDMPAEPRIAEKQDTILSRTATLLEEAQVRYQCLCESGNPADQIIRVAEREDVELIVLGSRGLGVLKSLLLGSVSEHIVHHAPCSVLIVR